MVELNDTPENDLPVAMPPGIPSEGLIREPNPKLFPKDVLKLYTVFDYRHAAAILATEFKSEFEEICRALRTFRFTDEQVKAAGGNESAIPKTFSSILRPMKWKEGRLNARLMVDEEVVSQDSHKIDYVKNRIAFDLEWNSKDQTFDRDLAAFRAFFDYGRISVGILVTRDSSLVPYFRSLGKVIDKDGKEREVIAKYGAEGGSTTHINKLLPRLRAGRSGGCPVLVFGITPALRKGK